MWAGFAAALAMLLYDQVNMALVTGAVAMLFWMMMSLPQGDVLKESDGARGKIWKGLFGGVLLAGAVAILAVVWVPLMGDGFAWDSRPYEVKAIAVSTDGRYAEALDLLNKALERNPLSVRLWLWRIQTKAILRQSVAEDIRHVLTIERADARIRFQLATMNSDLPVAERKALLREALLLNKQVAADEPRRLTAEQEGRAEAVLGGPGE